MHYYISRNYRNTDSAGSKAKTDMERIMERRGMRNAGLRRSACRSRVLEFAVNLAGVVKALFTVGRGDTLVLQYPLKKYFSLICRVSRLKGCKTVALIHDLGCCRRRKLTVGQEINRLSLSDRLIALNPSMQQWLSDNGCASDAVSLGIWDYLSDVRAPVRKWATDPENLPKIVYAGALAHRKNEFLYKWKPTEGGYRVSLYGTGFDSSAEYDRRGIEPKGFMTPDDLISGADGYFGLVWDGDSLDECSGNFGDYLRLNNPHKTSLYIRCGLPVLIWRRAALAPFIEDAGVGVAIDSLHDIPAILAKMTPERYDTMVRNVAALSQKMAEGRFFNTALDKVLSL